MRIRSTISMLCLGSLMLTMFSCKKFLSEYSQNYAYVRTPQDLDELLVGSGYMNIFGNFGWHLLDDDVDANPPSHNPGTTTQYYHGLFYWQPNAYLTNTAQENLAESSVFNTFYAAIANVNTVISNAQVIQVHSVSDQQILQRVSGEAHFLRGYYYFILANLFGKPFNTATSEKDYCVPLKLDPAVEDRFFTRASVGEVYRQIVSDLATAETELADFNKTSVVRPNQAMSQALLSRVYLYMQQYPLSISYADKVLSLHYTLKDLRGPGSGTPFLTLTSSETIFAIPSYGIETFDLIGITRPSPSPMAQLDNFCVSADLIQQYQPEDRRPAHFFVNPSAGEFLDRKASELPNICREFNIRLPEMVLNKSESLALLGDLEGATAAIGQLCEKRYENTDPSRIPTAANPLIDFIRAERRRELCFEVHRWFDLRRYAVNDKRAFEKKIMHTAYGYDGSSIRIIKGYYELDRYHQDAAAYVLPIPQSEISFNQGSLTNEQRPDRPLKN